jgi:branched-chain amino acid transport system substrate-binding protein
MKNRKYLSILALVGALTLVAAACGDDDGGETTGGGGATATGGAVDCEADEFGCVEIPAGTPIQLGSLNSISGDTAALGTDVNNGVTLAIDYLDGALDQTPGQLLGHDVDLVLEDDLCSPEGGQSGGTALAANPDIVAVMGTTCSGAALGVADQILGDKGILLVSASNTNPGLTSEEAHQPFYFRTAHNDKIQGAIVAEYLYNELELTQAATINDESPYAEGLAQAFRDNWEALGGTITAEERVNSGDTDLGPVLTSIAESDPEVLYGPNFNPVCALTAVQSQDIMPDVLEVGSDGCLESGFLEPAGDLSTEYLASYPDTTVFASGEFYSNEFLPAYKELTGGAPTAGFHAHAFDAASIVFDAIEAVAVDDGSGNLTISRTALRDALMATSGYEGITGIITCTPLGDCATDVSIGIFEYPDWNVEGAAGGCTPSCEPVYSDTKSLDEVI